MLQKRDIVFRFDSFEIDEGKRELRRDGEVVPLEPKAFALLCYLVRNRERVVSRDEILDTVWSGEFVSPWSVSSCVRKVRQGLGTQARSMLRTFRGQGLRFVGDCEELRGAQPQPAPGRLLVAPLASGMPIEHSLLGRSAQIEILRTALADAFDGRGRTILLTGAQGIGKSTLARVLRQTAADLGAVVAEGAAYEGEGAPSFWPWVQVLREVCNTFDHVGSVDPRSWLDPALAPLLPDLMSSTAASVDQDSSQFRFRTYDAVCRCLEQAARHAPIVVILEDLHWADDVSLSLLRFAARQLSRNRILVVATQRDDESPQSPSHRSELVRLRADPSIRRVRLEGLDEAATEELLRILLPLPAPPELAARVREISGGVPLLIEQLATHLFDVARAHDDPKASIAAALEVVPDASQEIVENNLARLAPQTKAILALASVLGASFAPQTPSR